MTQPRQPIDLRAPEQQVAIDVLLAVYDDFHVEPPLEDGSLEVRKDGRHLCFVDLDGKVIGL